MKRKFGKLGRIFMLLLALALVLVPITSSLADIPTLHNNTASITVSKELRATTPGVFPPVSTFQFLLSPVGYVAGPTSAGSIAYNSTNLPMPSGGSAGVPRTINVGTFLSSLPGQSTQTHQTTTNPITYTQAGVYTYSLREIIPTTPVAGVIYDPALYYINVYVNNVLNNDGTPMMSGGLPVVNVYAITGWETTNSTSLGLNVPDNGGLPPIPSTPGEVDVGKIAIIVPNDTDGNIRNLSYPFVNTYDTASLIISKVVTGDIADPNKVFDFTLALNTPAGAVDSATYSYQKYSMGTDRAVGGGDDVAVGGLMTTTSSTRTFTLLHNQYIQIIGLPAGERVTTTENDAVDYTTSIVVQHGNTANPPVPTTINGKSTGQQTIVGGAGAVNQDSFTNYKQSVPPTGVLLDILPYVLLGVVAVILIVIVIKKRK